MLGQGADVLSPGDGATGDPASLGVGYALSHFLPVPLLGSAQTLNVNLTLSSALLLALGDWSDVPPSPTYNNDGNTGVVYADAVKREVEYLLAKAPRYANGAISMRVDGPELW